MTKKISFVFVVLLLRSQAFGDISYQIAIDAAQEVPTPTLGGVTPSGSATVDVNTITGDVTISGNYSGLTSNAAAAHLQGLAPSGSTAGVLFGLDAVSGMSGSLTGMGTLSSSDLQGLLNGEAYINLHTANNGAGEIRGQVVDSDISVFQVSLDAMQEVPTPSVGGATPTGSATVVVDSSTGDVEISGSYSGLTGAISGSHLHGLAGPGATAGVLFGLSNSGGTSGTFSGAGILSSSDLSGLLAGNSYINIHTGNNAPGEIRGQVVVPEPSGMALLAFAIVGLCFRRKRI